MPEVRLEETDRGPALVSERLRISVHLNKGTFGITDASNRTPIRDAAASVLIADGPAFTTRGNGLLFEGSLAVDDAHGKGLSVLLRRERDESEPEVVLTLTLYEDHPFALAGVELENDTPAPVRVAALHPLDGARLDFGAPAGAWRWYKHGWQSWSQTLVLPCSGEDMPLAPPVIGPGTQPEAIPGRFHSELMTAIVEPASDSGLVAGFVSTAEQMSQLWLDRESSALTAASYADGVTVDSGRRLSSERLLIEPTGAPLQSLGRYGDALGREMGALTYEQVASGWCSWYHYFQSVREEDIVANLEELAARRDELPLTYVQIDDGYQADIGDWLTPNAKFPHGMPWLVDKIHAAGFQAGLWLAPFLMGENSQLYREHPDWAVQFKPGKPYIAQLNWGQRCFALDLTRAEVIEWLEGVFRTICDDWGFDYVKIDFVYAGAVDGIRRDPNVTRAQAYRHGLEAIRRAVGDRFILGCGNPLGPSVGLVDGARISPDVAPFWTPRREEADLDATLMSRPSALNAIRNILSRFWMHGRLWMNDPDCLLVRDDATALSLDEVRTLATVIALSGGMVLDSDDLTKLPAERREIISMLLPVYGRSAVPLDLFQVNPPRLFQLDCGTHALLAVFNWDDQPQDVGVRVPGQDVHVFEAWERRRLASIDKEIPLRVAAHGCHLLALRPAAGRPQVIGSGFHLLQGALEVAGEEWDGDALRISLRPVAKRRGELYLHVPDGFGPPQADGAAVREVADGVWALGFELRNDLTLEVTLGGA